MPSLSGARLMGLCTIAVGAIYAAGYLYTEPSAQANAIAAFSPTAGAAPHHAATSAKSASPTPGPTRKASPHPGPVYKDGVHTGFASNPYGTLSVAVTVIRGKIATVKITSYNMHYPQSVIDPQLPQEAVAKQTWRIYIVSGATASTYNFAEAVYNALQKARG
jgi:uncharacterized protein with FMN-binding domain